MIKMHFLKRYSFSIILIVILSLTSCVFIKPVKITEIKSIQIENISMSSAKLMLKLNIENTNFIKLKVSDINLDVHIEDELLGEINEISSFVIPANSDEQIDVKLEVKFSGMLSKSFRIIKLLSKPNAKIKLDGTITARSFGFKKVVDINEENIVSLFKN